MGDEPVWERFLATKFTHDQQGSSQLQQGILDGRNVNLNTASIALNSDEHTAKLMCEMNLKSPAELLPDKASRELARRNRYVEYIRVMLSRAVADRSGRARKTEIAMKCIEAIHSGLVVDRPARELLGVLLAELDDVDTDRVPLIVDAILDPLLEASQRQGSRVRRGEEESDSMSETAAAGLLLGLELLPKLLALTAGLTALGQAPPVPELVRGLSGAQFRERVVSRILRARWPVTVYIGICQALRDLDLGERQLRVAVSRVLRHLRRRAALHDLPPLTYQLLLLSGRGSKEAALEGVIRVFDRLDASAESADREDAGAAGCHIPMRCGGRLGSGSTEELRFVEGTILLHFNFAMKQDHGLARCLLKGFQRRAVAPEVARAFTLFRVALLLSMACIQRFGRAVLDLVQDIITDCNTYDHSRSESAWLEAEEEHARGTPRRGNIDGGTRQAQDADGDVSDGEGAGGAGSSSASAAAVVEKVLLAVVRSSRGWDHLVGSLLKLGLQLLDRGGAVAKAGSAAGATRGMLEKLQGSPIQRASMRASNLGRVLLMETFKTHEVVRRQVLTSVLEQVTARSQGVMGYVKLLGLLAERNPNLLLDNAEAVRDVFGYISVLSPPVAERFLRAVAPLLRLRPRLQDGMVLPLRKALFSREERARLVAVGGLVLLLGIQSREAGSRGTFPGHGVTQLSQASQSSEGQSAQTVPVGMGLDGAGGGALSLAEGFGLLRRCLTQQLVVRTKLYDGLLAAFRSGSLELQLDTVSLLGSHFRRYVNVPAVDVSTSRRGGTAGDQEPIADQPLLLKRCVDPSSGHIVEPIPVLIGCLYRMLRMGRESLAAHEGSTRDGEAESESPAGSLHDNGLGETLDPGRESAAVAAALRDSLDELDDDLKRLSATVSSAQLGSFGLDKIADFSPDGGPGTKQNLAAAALLCASYEALMQGVLVVADRSLSQQEISSGSSCNNRMSGVRRRPSTSAVRALLDLFDRRQTLLELVRPSLPTPAQQRSKRAGGNLGSHGSSINGAGGVTNMDPEGVGSSSANNLGVGSPGVSGMGCFALTLYPGGMPCLGMTFVEDMLAVVNVEAGSGAGDPDATETEGCTEQDTIGIDAAGDEPPIQAVKEDLGLQRLVLETCRGHLRTLRTSTAAVGSGLSVEVGGGDSTRGAGGTASSESVGMQNAPQDEADATRAGKAAVKKCNALAPLVLREVFRQLTEGNTSGTAKAAADAAKATNSKGGKGKAKGKGGAGFGVGGVDTGKKKAGRGTGALSESLAELAFACLEECVCITAYSSPRPRTVASRTAKLLAAAYRGLPDSNVPPAGSAGGSSAGASVLGRHSCALLQTLRNLIADEQVKEAEVLCRILSQLTRLLRLEPPALQGFAASLRVVCGEQRVTSPVLAKAMISLYLQAHMSMQGRGDHVDALHDLAAQVRPCLGLLSEEEDDEEDVSLEAVSFRVINNFTIAPVSEMTLSAMEECIEELEYALRLLQKAAVARQARDAVQRLSDLSYAAGGNGGADSQSTGGVSEGGYSSDASVNSDRDSNSDSEAGGVRSDGGFGERDPLDRRESLMCDRLHRVMQAMAQLIGSRLEHRSIEKLVSCASRVFRIVTKVLKLRLSLKRAYVGAGLRRVLESKKRFTKKLQALLPWLEGEKGAKVTKNKISRQSRIVPELIFQVEQCDVHLLKLGKLCKGLFDVAKWVTHRVDRDFRIDRKVVSSCQQEEVRARARKAKRKPEREKSSVSTKRSKKASPNDGDPDGASDEDEEEDEGRRTPRRENGGGGPAWKKHRDEDEEDREDDEDRGQEQGSVDGNEDDHGDNDDGDEVGEEDGGEEDDRTDDD